MATPIAHANLQNISVYCNYQKNWSLGQLSESFIQPNLLAQSGQCLETVISYPVTIYLFSNTLLKLVHLERHIVTVKDKTKKMHPTLIFEEI